MTCLKYRICIKFTKLLSLGYLKANYIINKISWRQFVFVLVHHQFLNKAQQNDFSVLITRRNSEFSTNQVFIDSLLWLHGIPNWYYMPLIPKTNSTLMPKLYLWSSKSRIIASQASVVYDEKINL
jgi:hypothetical protein